jgi:hypothetical protein
MSIDVIAPSRPPALDSAAWSEAQIFDTQITPDLTVRALVCRLPGSWQWCVVSIDGDSGAVISVGVADSAAAARRVAADEVAKCLENAIL